MKKTLLLLAIITCLVAFGPEASKPIRSAASTAPTYNKEVVRIFQQNCQTCHHTGYIAPFALTSYTESKPYAPAIKDAVQTRRMPPWKATPGCGDFFDARILDQDQIDTLVKWVDAGAPEGDPADLPPPLSFSGNYLLGKPDLELTPDETYKIPATGN